MRHTYTASLCWGGDIQTGEAEVTVTYAVDWDEPQTRLGSEIVDVEVISVDGFTWQSTEWRSFGFNVAEAHETLVEKMVDENWDQMIEHAIEAEASEDLTIDLEMSIEALAFEKDTNTL